MFRFLLKLISKVAKRSVRSVKNILPQNIYKQVKSSMNIKRSLVKRFREVERKTHRFTGWTKKGKLIKQVSAKAAIIENLISSENLLLGTKTNVERQLSETVKVSTKDSKYLRNFTHKELKDMNNAIDQELKGLGLDSAEDIERVITSEEFRQDIVKTNSYQSFMDNWKSGFFAYKPEDLGMSEDEREAIWQDIVNEKGYTWFEENKLSK